MVLLSLINLVMNNFLFLPPPNKIIFISYYYLSLLSIYFPLHNTITLPTPALSHLLLFVYLFIYLFI